MSTNQTFSTTIFLIKLVLDRQTKNSAVFLSLFQTSFFKQNKDTLSMIGAGILKFAAGGIPDQLILDSPENLESQNQTRFWLFSVFGVRILSVKSSVLPSRSWTTPFRQSGDTRLYSSGHAQRQLTAYGYSFQNWDVVRYFGAGIWIRWCLLQQEKVSQRIGVSIAGRV